MTAEINKKIESKQNLLNIYYKDTTKLEQEIASLKEQRDREVRAQDVMLRRLHSLGFHNPHISPDGEWLQADNTPVCRNGSIAYQMIKDLILSP